MPGEMFFSDANETLLSSEEVIKSLKSDPTTEIDELNIFEISNDSNEKKLTTQINIIPGSTSDDSSESEVNQNNILPAPITAKTTMKVNISSSTTTVKPITIISRGYDTVVTAAEPNIAQPISSKKDNNQKENTAPGVVSSNLSYVIFTCILVHFSKCLIS